LKVAIKTSSRRRSLDLDRDLDLDLDFIFTLPLTKLPTSPLLSTPTEKGTIERFEMR
jgi:hypothetical protein